MGSALPDDRAEVHAKMEQIRCPITPVIADTNPNAGPLIMGLLILSFGLFHVFVSQTETPWARRLRESVRWGKGDNAPPVSRLGCLVSGFSWMLFGAAAVLDGYFQLLGPTFTPVMVFAAVIIFFAAAICDSADHRRGKRRRRAIESGRCPRCGYDVRATPMRCPECGEERTLDECAGT